MADQPDGSNSHAAPQGASMRFIRRLSDGTGATRIVPSAKASQQIRALGAVLLPAASVLLAVRVVCWP